MNELDWWQTPIDYGGARPMTPTEMREQVGRRLAQVQLTSDGERQMALLVDHLVKRLASHEAK
ncbi:hypothetical protein [Nocardioides bruguierae]|uniref:hypothetical protein n=1 Tax=Nocardioides bruguierae TaxID=2945102 RepID=UPI002020B99B|nr:hypothetical protein [Nocardioides bruguierae]MCL8026296.1 hypothetical protein [Nocardioides bruguierae]